MRPGLTPLGLGRCLRATGPFDKLRANGGGWGTPFGLSLSKPYLRATRPFDRLRANGGGWSTPFGLSLSKPCPRAHGRRSAP
jgi:hypothetical protein